MTVTPGTGVTPEDIASVQEAQEEMMPEVVTLQERVNTPDGRGGTSTSYLDRTPQVIARIGTVRDNMRTAFAGVLRGKATAILTVPVGTPLVEQDRIVWNTAKFNVVADLSKSSYATAARYLIEEV